MFYLLLNDFADRTGFISEMKQYEINCVFHYVPLHSSPYGLVCGRANGALTVTTRLADRLVRLPLWLGLEESFDSVMDRMLAYLGQTII
jgi:dTDP-4-amino-4,6-dideoxygalactose transaminase